MFKKKQRRAAGAVPPVARADPADAVMQGAVVIARRLGIDDRAIARSALTAAVTLAAEDGDPDGLIRELVAAAMEGNADGR